jgi:phytoene dehydrogenase-like protein
VIGANVGGLLAARALAEHYERVTVFERDALPQNHEPRNGG